MAVSGTLDTPLKLSLRRKYRPILTPKTVLPLFFAVGVIFAPIGGGLLYASAQVSFGDGWDGYKAAGKMLTYRQHRSKK